ncbi:chromate transporter [Marinilactibacillus kalidii]|uniref:chromate transporter n=1 Tax=Marinilactibacillus kalidii TaxID=2820274 RepID=UPI001ABDE269|nr:chromate transporter [Marinilactibacillus kalidii]
MKKSALYWKLFTSTLYLSSFTFGGGYVIVPLMEKKFVQELNWIDEDEMLDLISISQSSPGSLAVNASILIGYRMAGFLGAMTTVLGTILAPLTIITLLSFVYNVVRDNPIVSNLLLGMQAGVAAIIVHVVYSMGMRIIRRKEVIPVLVMIAALIAGILFNVNILYLLFFSGVIGGIATFYQLRTEEKGGQS